MKNDVLKQLYKRKSKVLEKWMEIQLEDDGLRENLITNDNLHNQSEELLYAFLSVLTEESVAAVNTLDLEPTIKILETLAVTRAHDGYSPRETALYIFCLKEAILQSLKDDVEDPVRLNDLTVNINRVIDHLSIIVFETFLKGREEVILRQTDEIAEVSTPVIQLWDGILGLPIIGTLDSARTQIVMENLLEKIVSTRSSIAILDISGVPAMDSMVAQHLIKTVSATRLMGAECIISGIRPEIAQTVVHLGIDLSKVVTKASLASALRHAFGILQMEVKKRPIGASPVNI